jgi:hypothetical protein
VLDTKNRTLLPKGDFELVIPQTLGESSTSRRKRLADRHFCIQ